MFLILKKMGYVEKLKRGENYGGRSNLYIRSFFFLKKIEY